MHTIKYAHIRAENQGLTEKLFAQLPDKTYLNNQ